jgi:hypothetical protein
MNCRDVRDVADSFLCEELLTETNHEILRHLDTCASCRAEIDARRRLRGALRAAFNRAPELEPREGFQDRLRDRLRHAAAQESGRWTRSRRWFALAASVVFVAGLSGAVILTRRIAPAEALALDAAGDHKNCALKFRLVRMPVPLEEAAQQFDSAYRLLIDAPPDEIPTPGGPVRVLERHSCAYGARRFGHVIMQYREHVVSLLMTTDERAADAVDNADAIPHVIGRPLNGLSVVSVNGSSHAFLLVSDLGSADLTQLSASVSVPLMRRLEGSLTPKSMTLAALYSTRPVQ